MQFHKLAISVTLAIATTAGMQSATLASTQYDFIKAIGRQTAQLLAIQPEAQAESISTNHTGHSFFNRSPELIRATASQTGAYTPSTYKFTLTIPKDAGQPLKAIKIAQSENVETVKFDVSNSKAFFGNRSAAGSEIRLASIGGDRPSNAGEAVIVFDQPVQPGNTVTVALAVPRNPTWGGVYQFGVTAYPAGDNGLGLFLGYGRINLYGSD